MKHFLLALPFVVVLISGCGSSGSVVQTKPLQGRLKYHNHLVIETSAQDKSIDTEFVAELGQIILKKANAAKLFKRVNLKKDGLTDGALVIKANLTMVKYPERGGNLSLGSIGIGTSSNQAEAKAKVNIIEARKGSNRVLSSLVARGDSSRATRSSAGVGSINVDTTSQTGLISEALSGLAEHIVNF